MTQPQFQGVLNDKIPLFSEVLKNANDSSDPVASLKTAISKDPRITAIFGYLANPKFNMGLPSGEPPYKPSDDPVGMSEIDVLRLHQKIYVLYQNDLPRHRKESILIQWLEQMSQVDAKILISVKDKSLVDLYPNLGEFVIVDALGWDHTQYQKMKS